MTELRIGSLFSGAGGLDLAVQQVFGGEVVWHAEIDKAASKVLAHRFPGVPNLGDISAVDWADVPEVDVLCGGFPCQDVSAAGKRAGIKDGTRSGLWAVFAEAIDALRPRYVVVENVRGLLSAEAKRSEVDEQQPCVCGWLDRWRRFSGSGLPEARESAGSLELLRLGDDWDDRAGEADSGVDSPGVGRIASPAQGGGREGVPSLAVAGVGRQSSGDSADAVAAFEIEGTAGATCVGSGTDSGEPSKDEQWRCGVDTAIACRVREDQAADAPAERERPRCEECGGFLPSGATDSGVESANAALGNGSDGPLLRAAGAVCADLAERGYDAQWATVSAASVGAPHRRERVFVLATDTSISPGVGLQQQDLSALQQRWGDRRPGQSGVCDCGDSACVADAADAPRYGWDEGRAESAGFVGGSDVAVSGDEPGVALLPTPTQSDGTGGGIRTGLSWEGTTKSTGDGGNSRLRDVAGLLGPLLPTPNAQDGNGGGRYSSAGHQSTLPGEVRLLPTPRSSDCFGAGQHGDGGMDLRTTISLLPTPRTRHGDSSESGLRRNSPGIEAVSYHFPDSQWGKYAAAIRRWESIVGPAPAPTEPNKNGNPRLSAAFSEWLMGWPAGWVTDPAIGISRNDQLRIVGNGVCPQQAVAALRFLVAVASGTPSAEHQRERADVTLLPTPTTSDSRGAKCGGAHDENVRVPRLAAAVEVDLPREIALLPTPCAGDHKDGDSAGVHAQKGTK